VQSAGQDPVLVGGGVDGEIHMPRLEDVCFATGR